MKAKNWLSAVAMAVVAAMALGVGPAWAASGTSDEVTVWTVGSYEVNGHVAIEIWPFALANEEYGVQLDGNMLYSSPGPMIFDWYPQTLGTHKLTCLVEGKAVADKTVNVSSLAFSVPQGPNPPTEEDPNLSITPVTRSFGTGGGGAAIAVSGSGTWAASASDSWITLKAASGQAGLPLAYTVAATTNVEGRMGYVYVSGHVHTVTQDGLGATISPECATFESAGGTGMISVMPPDQMSWQARVNVDWVNVSPVSGSGEGTVTFTVAPLNEVVTRQGTLTVAGNTFTVFQYGRRIKLSPAKAEYDYLTHVIPITVDAMANTSWNVEPQNGWISVEEAGTGKGDGQVTVAIAENPSWKARTGTVKIGEDTFTVVQKGRTVLEFGISPASTTANVEGGNGLIEVTATPDLPWSAESQTNWLTIYTATATGAGNGNVVYSASPNPTLYDRTGTITVAPGDALAGDVQTHSVTQPAAASALSATGYEFDAAGENCEVHVSVADIVQWRIENANGWLKVRGETNRVGPSTVTLQAEPNETVQTRRGTVTLAGKTFKVAQRGWNVEVSYEAKVFGTDGGDGTFLVHPDGDVAWTAVASDPTWITIWDGESGTGSGEVMYIVSPYVGDGNGRTGSITVGDKVIRIIQRVNVFPEVQDAVDVVDVLEAAADKRLGERIATVAEYDSFRAWIAEKKLDVSAVMESEHAWPSYALGTETLFGSEPTIQIGEMSVRRDGARGEGEVVTMAVSVTVLDGGKAVFIDAAKIATMFKATGDLFDWNSEAKLSATATQTGSDGATMQFEVALADGTSGAAFLRLLLSQWKAPQTICFAPIIAQTALDRVELSATASSGGAVMFTVVSGPGKIEGNILSFNGGGTVTVLAVQEGDDLWLAASAMQTVTVRPKPDRLLHRWSFNGDFMDSVDGTTATYSGKESYSWTNNRTALSLPGGSRGSSAVSLGLDAVPSDGTPVTIEIWAKQREIKNWSRIFELTTVKQGWLIMTWSCGTSTGTDLTEIHETYMGVDRLNLHDVFGGFSTGTEFHISLVMEPNKDGSNTFVRVAKRDAQTGEVLASAEGYTSGGWTVEEFAGGEFWLGRSSYGNVDLDAAADYNEVRIWNIALSDEQLTRNAQLGPDTLPDFPE